METGKGGEKYLEGKKQGLLRYELSKERRVCSPRNENTSEGRLLLYI